MNFERFLFLFTFALTGCVFQADIVEINSSAPAKLQVIHSQSILEGEVFTIDINLDTGQDNPAGYQCFVDQTIDNSVSETTSCSNISGLTFDSSTGEFSWSPDYTASGAFEFNIMSLGEFSANQIFTINVGDKNAPPFLSTTNNQIVNENSPITQINFFDTSTLADIDIDGTALSYSCYFDNVIDAAVPMSTNCSTLVGFSFNNATGVIDWTPDFNQMGNYEFIIIADDGPLNDNQIFNITVNNIDRAPLLAAISDETVNESNAITAINANDTSGGDTDIDGDNITYSCYYDSAIDATVPDTNACTSLTGVSFDTVSGAMSWTPNNNQAGTYEFKITGSAASLSDDEIFAITVSNVNLPPVLAAISNQAVNENAAITAINAADTSGGDTDIDGQTITYTCYYDTLIDTNVLNTLSCSSLLGVSFNTTTGELAWTPSYAQAAVYEFKITGSDGALSDDEFFTITVNNVNLAPILAAISDQSVVETSAITTINAADTSGGDTDVDGQALTYTCYYDLIIDASVANTTLCSTLTGLSFTGTTGVVDWTPTAIQAGAYEFKISGSDGALSDDELFAITVFDLPSISITDVTVNENSTANLTVSLSSAIPQTATVNFATADNSAGAGSDYTSNSGTVTFLASETSKTVSITVSSDLLYEPSESFFVNLSSPTNATIADNQGVVTITDTNGQPTLSIADTSVTDGGSNMVFTVSLSHASYQNVQFNWATANDSGGTYPALSAAAGGLDQDYIPGSATGVTITAGNTSTNISASVNSDTTDEFDDTFLVNLSVPVNTTISDAQAIGTITNSDLSPTLNFSAASSSILESTGSGNTSVTLSEKSEKTVTVNYVSGGGSATSGVDYTALSGTLTYTPTQTSKTLSITVADDGIGDDGETFDIDLSAPSNATLGTSTHTVTTSEAFVITISVDTANYNIYNDLRDNQGWNEIDTPTVILNINAGVTVYSNSTATSALATGALPVTSSVTINNSGTIMGKGGAGGSGGNISVDACSFGCAYSGTGGGNGGDGGDAIATQVDITLNNTSGNIYSGGGGGGASGGGAIGTGVYMALTTGAAGGGGAGYGTSSAGSIGTRSGVTGSAPYSQYANGNAGTAGGATGGAGGLDFCRTCWDNSSIIQGTGCSGTAGSGGNYGLPGGDGTIGSTIVGNNVIGTPWTPALGLGGSAGNAVFLNGNVVTWTGGNNGTQVKGPVN